MKKVRLFCIVGTALVLACVVISSVTLKMQPRLTAGQLEYQQAFREAVEEHDKMAETIKDVVGWNPDETYSEVLLPCQSYGDKDGNTINIQSVLCFNPQQRGGKSTSIFNDEIFDPATAEENWDVDIGEKAGTIYRKNGRCYLVWVYIVSDDKEQITSIDYDPSIIEEWEIIKMAGG